MLDEGRLRDPGTKTEELSVGVAKLFNEETASGADKSSDAGRAYQGVSDISR